MRWCRILEATIYYTYTESKLSENCKQWTSLYGCGGDREAEKSAIYPNRYDWFPKRACFEYFYQHYPIQYFLRVRHFLQSFLLKTGFKVFSVLSFLSLNFNATKKCFIYSVPLDISKRLHWFLCIYYCQILNLSFGKYKLDNNTTGAAVRWRPKIVTEGEDQLIS